MAFLYAEAAADTLSHLITRVRRLCGYKETVTTDQRWSNDEILDSLNLQLMEMGNALHAMEMGAAIKSANLTWTGGADQVILPAGPRSQPIVKVEDITEGKPLHIDRVDIFQIENLSGSSGVVTSNMRGWTLRGDYFLLRPSPGGDRTIRIWYVRSPYIIGAAPVSGSGVIASNVLTVTVGAHGFSAGMRVTVTGFSVAGTITDVAIASVTETTIVINHTATNEGPSTVTVTSAYSSDQHPLAVQNEELICRGASIRLQEEDAEIPPGRQARYDRLWLQFLATSARVRGPKHVRNNRRFR